MVHQNAFRPKLVTHIFLWVFGLCCHRQALAQTQLIRDNQNHTVDFNGGDLVQEFLVPTDFTGRIYFEIYGGDGGRKKNSANGTGIRAKGGQGARIGAWFNINSDNNGIPPGSEILFIIGEHGDNLNGIFATGAGGGGGTAVFYKDSDNIYHLLMVAGGGAGGYADCCTVSEDGDPGEITTCPVSYDLDGYYCDNSDVGLESECIQGGGTWTDASTAQQDDFFGQGNVPCWPESFGCDVYGKRGWPGCEHLHLSSSVKPTGGAGGTNSAGSDCYSSTITPPDSDGGFGFGGGAAGTPLLSGGAGGGFSGGLTGFWENSGGGSMISSNYALTSPEQVKEKRSSTSDPQHGKVIYRIETLNNFPVAVCNNLTVNLNSSGTATVQATLLATGSSDPDGNNTLSFTASKDGSNFASSLTLGCSQAPLANVTVKVSDGAITRQCTSSITVNDNTPPAVTCKSATLPLYAGNATLATSMVLNTVVDNCTASPALTLSKTNFNCADVGNNTVTLTATDNKNNSSTCVANVEVTNNPVSSFTCSSIDRAIDQASSILPSAYNPKLVYSCLSVSPDQIDILYEIGQFNYDCQNLGINPVILKAVHPNGTTLATCSTTIRVFDYAPEIECRNASVELVSDQPVSISPLDLELSSYDNCGIISHVASKTSFDCGDVGPNFVLVTVTNSSGYSVGCYSTVWVVDHSLPSLSCDPQIVSLDPVGYANITPQSYNPQITYSCNSTASNTEVVYEVGKFDYDCQDLGTQPITLKLVSVDNPESTALATCSTTLTIVDQTPPQVTCKNITVELGNDLPVTISPLDLEESSSDNCGIATRVLSHKRFNCNDAGLRTIILTVTDYGGNTAYCFSDVRIVDVVPPQAVCRDVTVQLFPSGQASADPWYTGGLVSLSDNCSTTAFVAHTGPTFYSCEDVGTFEVALFVYDYEGNESLPCWHSVTVVDLIPPTARCLETKSVYIGDGAMYAFGPDDIDNGSSDACGLAGSETDIQLFTCDDVGVHTVTLTVTDVNGNSSTCTTTVYVEDVVPPTLVCQNAAVTFNGESALTPAPENLAQVMDNCSNLEWSMDPPEITCDAIGQAVPVTVTVTDLSSQSATCISYVTVSGIPCGWVDTPEGIDCPEGNEVAYDPVTETFTLTSSGCFSPGNSADESSYIGYSLCGDGVITAHIASLTKPGRAGIVMRESAAPGAKKVEISNKGIKPLTKSVRYNTDGNAHTSNFPASGSKWLRLVRTGDHFMGYFSADGVSWNFAFDVIVSMAGCIEVGLFAEGVNPVSTVTATFDHVVIESPSGSALPRITHTTSTQTALALDPVGMDLWPNPTSGIVTLELTGAWADAGNDALDIAVFDSFGRLIRSIQPGAFSDPVITLDLKGQPPGLYLVRIKDTKGAIIVQRLVLTDR